MEKFSVMLTQTQEYTVIKSPILLKGYERLLAL